jgi:hypothetical protein
MVALMASSVDTPAGVFVLLLGEDGAAGLDSDWFWAYDEE